jgi:hypothetical protein
MSSFSTIVTKIDCHAVRAGERIYDFMHRTCPSALSNSAAWACILSHAGKSHWAVDLSFLTYGCLICVKLGINAELLKHMSAEDQYICIVQRTSIGICCFSSLPLLPLDVAGRQVMIWWSTFGSCSTRPRITFYASYIHMLHGENSFYQMDPTSS